MRYFGLTYAKVGEGGDDPGRMGTKLGHVGIILNQIGALLGQVGVKLCKLAEYHDILKFSLENLGTLAPRGSLLELK